MKFKKRLVGLMIATALTTFTGALVSCSKSGDSGNTPILPGEETQNPYAGDYYFAAADGEYSLTVGSSSVTLTMGGKTVTGAYVYDEASKKFTIVFSDDKDIGSATVSDYGLTLKYKNANYEFLKKETYKVSFNVDGGAAMTDADVVNGKTLQKPSDAVKEGYWFVGWYADAECKKAYDFDAPVHGAMTLYARFVQKTEQEEFAVKYVVDGAEYATAETKGGKIYNNELPTPTKEGKTFAGWWVSDYEDANKLTYKYNENELGQDTTFYALWEEEDKLYVSVTENGVSWNALPSYENRYKVDVFNADGQTVATDTTYDTSFEVKFTESKYKEGEYTIVVKAGDVTTTAYYKNKALSTVSHFRVDDTRLLTFNEIKGAEKYIITVECGDETHQHAQVETNTPTYNFADCAMQAGGIKFTVQAKANGYMSSEKATYSFEATLGALTGLKVDGETELVSWDAVENATEYVVEITNGGKTETKTTKTTSLSLKGTTGSYEIKVTPTARAYNSSATQTTTFNNTRLAVPMGLTIDAATQSLVWNEVEGATGYTITIAGQEYKVTEAKFLLEAKHFSNNLAEITVQATCADASKTSLASDTFTARVGEMDKLTYANGTLSWQAVLGAEKYGVKVGDGAEFTVTSSQTAITFAAAGDVTIQVCCYNADGDPSAWVETLVKVYEVKFNVSGGVGVTSLYKAEGDQYQLDSLTSAREGYTFEGWYDKVLNGKEYKGTLTQGAANLTVYANWKAKSYKVTLDLGELGLPEGSIDGKLTSDVTYDSLGKLPVPTCTDETKIFAGWRTEPNNRGIEYTNKDGDLLSAWKNAEDYVLYASWYNIFEFEDITDEEGNSSGLGYIVKKGDGIGYLTEIKIPATYTDPETKKTQKVYMIDAYAFENCSSLTKISIPHTIESIYMPADGSYAQGSPFYNCSNLKEIEVYEATGASIEKQKYKSANKALIYSNEKTGQEEIRFVPRKADIDGEYIIEDGVTIIPAGAFSNSFLKKLSVPASVVKIETNAFNGSSLTEIVFLAHEKGEEKSLAIDPHAFSGCKNITELTLPKRISSLTPGILDDLTNLTSITLDGNEVEDSDNSYFTENGIVYQGTTLVYYPRAKAGFCSIPSKITAIASEAFKGAKQLTGVRFHGGVTLIATSAFENASNMESVEFRGNAEDPKLTIEKNAFYNCDKLSEVTLPENLGLLEKHAFGGCNNLGRVYLNVSETAEIEAGAFANTDNTTFFVVELNIGSQVKDIAIAAVFGNKLTLVDVNTNNPYYTSKDGVLFDKDVTKIVYFPASKTGKYELPDTVTVISDNVFRSKKIESVTIPATVKEIGDYAFYDNSYLKEVVFSATENPEAEVALDIGEYAFASCDKLDSLTIPGRVTAIGRYAFANLNSLASLTFSEGTQPLDIGEYAFAYYKESSSQPYGKSLQTVAFPARLKTIGAHAFDYAFSYQNAQTAAGTVEIDIPEGVTEIGDYAFANNRRLKSVSLPASLQRLGLYSADKLTSMSVFDECPNLAEISVAQGNVAFATQNGVLYNAAETDLYFCPKKNAGNEGAVVIPNTVLKIWDEAFYQNSGITSVSFSGAVSSELKIGADVFNECKTLMSVALPEGLATLSKNLFERCTSLTEVTIPWTVTTIQASAFNGCKNLSKVDFQATPTGETAENLEFATCTSSTAIFKDCTALTALNLPERTTSIGAYAFYGAKFTEITIPKNVATIGQNAFQNNDDLTLLTFDLSNTELKSISNYAFSNCSKLTKVALPDSVETIGNYAFASSTVTKQSNLAEVTLSTKLTSIGQYAFHDSKITSIDFPATLETIGQYAFSGSSLKTVTFAAESALTKIDNYAFNYNDELLAIEIPGTVTTIGQDAFNGCLKLASITFGEKANAEEGAAKSDLKEVKDNAFRRTAIANFAFPETTAAKITVGSAIFGGCPNLENVHLSKGVQAIGSTFKNCVPLKNLTVAEGHENFSTKEGRKILYNAKGDGILYIYDTLTGEVDFSQDGLIELGDSVFQNQTKMTKIILPNTLQKIGKNVFDGCRSLQVVEFNAVEGEDFHITSIGDYAFAGTPLRSLTLPDSVNTLGANVFDGCKYLTEVTLPAGLATIGTKVFYNAIRLSNVTLSEGMKTIGQYMFAGTAIKSITIPASMEKIDNYAFQNCKELETVTFAGLAEGATSLLGKIGNYAFGGCTSIASFTVPDSVTTIGTNMFDGCTALNQIKLPSAITTISNYMFRNTAFTEFTVPDTVTAIGTYAFSGCKELTKVTIPKSVTGTLGVSAFSNCAKLSDVEIDADIQITQLGNSAFNGCESLTEFTIPKKVTKLGTYVFAKTSITNMEVPATIKSIGGYAFQNCKELESVTLGSATMETVGNNLFDGCSALTSVTLRDGLNTIGQYMFGASKEENVPALTKLTIPSTISTVGKNAFQYTKIASVDLSKTQISDLGSQVFAYANTTAVKLPTTCTKFSGNKTFYASKIESIDLSKVTDFRSDSHFENCENLTSVTLGSAVSYAGKTIFKGCTALTTLTLKEGFNLTHTNVSYQGQNMFENCTALTTVSFPNTLNKLPNNMFKGCTALQTIESWGGVESIGIYVFSKTAVKSVDLSSSKVSTFGSNAFYQCENLKSVKLANGIKSIGSSAFSGCKSLSEVTLPTALETISTGAFNECISLKTISVPETVTTIDANAFKASGLTSIDLSNTKISAFGYGTTISATSNANTFSDCKDLEEVKLPATLTAIGGYVFKNCTSLKSIDIPDGVTLIGKQAFLNTGITQMKLPKSLETLGNAPFAGSPIASYSLDSSNQNFQVIRGALYDPENVMIGYSSDLLSNGVLTLPTTCTSFVKVGSGSEEVSIFAGLNVEEVVLPESISYIPDYAFKNMTSLKRITIPATVNSIGRNAFEGCRNLETVTFEDGDTDIALGDNLFYYCKALHTMNLSARIKKMGKNMFGNSPTTACDKLKNIVLPEGMETLGSYTFSYAGLTSVTLPSTLKTIEDYAFKFSSITSIDLKNVETIGQSAFEESMLESITIPATVKTIEGTAFKNTKLTSVTVPTTVTSWGSGAFRDNELLTSVTLPEGLTEIPQYMFSGCTALTNVTLPQSLTFIAPYAFQGAGLTSIVVPENVTSLGGDKDYEEGKIEISNYNGAFQDCTNLTSVTLPSGLKEIGGKLFMGCNSLKEIVIPESVAFIGTQAFDGTGIQSIELKNPNIALYAAFQGMLQLKSVALPDGLKALGYKTFYGCEKLEEIEIPSSVEILGTYFLTSTGAISTTEGNTFTGTALKTVSLPNKLTEIAKETFKDCKKLESVEMGDNITEIGSSAFNGCSNLTTITLGELVETIGSSAFYNCSKLVEVYNKSVYLDVEAGKTTNGYVGQNAVNVYTYYLGSSIVWKENGFYFYTQGEDKVLVNYVGDATNVVIPEDVTIIAKNAFLDNADIRTLTVSDNVHTIEANAFEGCYNLYQVTLGVKVDLIGTGAFNECYKLVEVDNHSALALEMGATTNGSLAKYAKNVYTPTSGAIKLVTEGDFVFYVDGDEKMLVGYFGVAKDVAIPADVTAIGDYAFYNVKGLTTVTATGNAIKSVGDYAFAWGRNEEATLKSVNLGTAVETIGAYAFAANSAIYASLETVVLGTNLKTIGNYAFYWQVKLAAFDIGSQLTELGSYAFASCTSFAEITLPATLQKVGSNVFSNWTKKQKINVVATEEAVKENKDWSTSWLGTNAEATVVYDCLTPATPDPEA